MCSDYDPLELCNKIRTIVSTDDLKDNVVTTLWTTVASIGVKQEKRTLALTDVVSFFKTSLRAQYFNCTSQLAEALEILIANSKTRTREYYTEYLKILHKQGNLEKLLETAEQLHQVHTYDTTILEWICKIYNESKIEKTVLFQKLQAKISEYCNRLLEIHSDSSMGLFTLAVQKSDENLFAEAVDLLQKGNRCVYLPQRYYSFHFLFLVVSVRPGLLHAWVLLTECYSKLQLFDEALLSATKADKLLNSINNSNVALRSRLDKLRLEILSRFDDAEKLSEAVRIGETVSLYYSFFHKSVSRYFVVR